jgi:hypothetical protein
VTSATLRLTITESRKDQFPAPGIIDGVPPFTNPGLGDALVIHIAGDGVPTAADYGAPSLGNDPGVLIPAAGTPGEVVSVEATAAVKQALAAGASFVVFTEDLADARLPRQLDAGTDGADAIALDRHRAVPDHGPGLIHHQDDGAAHQQHGRRLSDRVGGRHPGAL